MKTDGDFYIGYAPKAPATLTRHIRRVVLLLLLFAVGLAAMLSILQADFDPGHFEYLEYRNFAGTLLSNPYPALVVERPGAPSPSVDSSSRYLLVETGKHGALPAVRSSDGRAVELEGALIYSDGWTMIELRPGTLAPAAAGAGPSLASVAASGEPVELRGEIVDSKCYLGVMKPGRGKPHRSCAVRCLSGGIPPLFLVETGAGERLPFLLVDAAGEPVNERILDFVGNTVELSGRIERWGDRWLLRADLDSLR